MTPVGSQQLRAQDPASALRCGIEEKTGHQRREGVNGDGNRGEGGDGKEIEYGDEHEGMDESGNGREDKYEGGGERKPGSQDARKRATLMSNQQPLLIHPRQREGLRVLERCHEERIINSTA